MLRATRPTGTTLLATASAKVIDSIVFSVRRRQGLRGKSNAHTFAELLLTREQYLAELNRRLRLHPIFAPGMRFVVNGGELAASGGSASQ